MPALAPSEGSFVRKPLQRWAEKTLSELAYLFTPQNHDNLHNLSPFGNDPYSYEAISRLESKHRRFNTSALTFGTALYYAALLNFHSFPPSHNSPGSRRRKKPNPSPASSQAKPGTLPTEFKGSLSTILRFTVRISQICSSFMVGNDLMVVRISQRNTFLTNEICSSYL